MEENTSSRDQLTAREKEILLRLSAGLSDQQIAAELFLSANTVRWYNRQIYAKLGVGNRTQAIAQAIAYGILPHHANQPVHTVTHQPVDQRVYFTHSFDGTRIAYSVAGKGLPLVKAANFVTHQDHDWDSRVWRHWLEELTRNHMLIIPDERGSGLSDWDVDDVSFEAWVRDLEAVVDAVGLEQFVLFGMSQGGAVAVAYAARHPERVSHLIVHGGYARGWLHRDLTEAQREEERLMISLMRVGWGRENPAFRQVFAMQLFPEGAPEDIHALEEHMRISVSPENAVRLESEMHRINVSHLAPQVKAPTLIVHARGDEAVPFNEGLLLASLIPNAQFVALESRNHLLKADEPAWQKFVFAFRSFLHHSE